MKRVAALCLVVAVPASGQPGPLPEAAASWTLRSDDCTGVHADGEPWDECGFQAYAMNDDATRVLTVSVSGAIQLWDGEGREIRRIDWADDWRSGATGYPTGKAAIVGTIGVAVVHGNQLILLDLESGGTLAQAVTELRRIGELRRVGDRLFAEIRGPDGEHGVADIDLATGSVRRLPGVADLMRVGPGYWVTGTEPPFTFHRSGGPDAEIALERSCMPFDEAYCVWRDIPGAQLHVFDVAAARWRSFDLERSFDGYTFIDLVRAGDRLFVLICGRAEGSAQLRPCSVWDLEARRTLHLFPAMHAKAVGAIDEMGRPEVRIALALGYDGSGETRRVAADGTVRLIEASLDVNPVAPGGGMVLPGWSRETAWLADAAGRPVARLPFPPRSCGTGWPSWTGECRFAADGRRWLVPRIVMLDTGPDDRRLDLTLFEMPAAGGEPVNRRAAPR